MPRALPAAVDGGWANPDVRPGGRWSKPPGRTASGEDRWPGEDPAKAQAMQNPAKDGEGRGFEPLRPCGLPVFKLLAGWGW